MRTLDAARTLALIRAGHPLRYQHVVQSHQLRVGWVFCIKVAVAGKDHSLTLTKAGLIIYNMDQMLLSSCGGLFVKIVLLFNYSS